MAAKELRDAWWKVLLVALPVVLAAPTLPAYESAQRAPERFVTDIALEQVWNMYGGGLWALGFLAILLGALLLSAETGRDTIFFLLSKPISRNRILFTKYAVCAGILLAAAILGHVLVLCVAVFAKGYPLGLFDAGGMALSTVLLWLASLTVLGLATIFSIVLRNPLASLAVTCAAMFSGLMLFILTLGYVGSRVSQQTYDTLSAVAGRVWELSTFASLELYEGERLAITNLLVWLTLAAITFLAALWIFRRRTY